MNWLDTETKELLQKVQDEKLAPPKTAEFGLVLVRKGNDYNRLTRAVVQINKCSERDAAKLASSQPPVVINPDLTEGEALWGQFELICSDAISLFLRSEVLEQNDRAYLDKLFNQVSHSDEFKPCTICLVEVPQTDAGEKFITQFLGRAPSFPATVTVPFKKGRIMEHWARRVGAKVILRSNESQG